MLGAVQGVTEGALRGSAVQLRDRAQRASRIDEAALEREVGVGQVRRQCLVPRLL